jgi:hypothetical protein
LIIAVFRCVRPSWSACALAGKASRVSPVDRQGSPPRVCPRGRGRTHLKIAVRMEDKTNDLPRGDTGEEETRRVCNQRSPFLSVSLFPCLPVCSSPCFPLPPWFDGFVSSLILKRCAGLLFYSWRNSPYNESQKFSANERRFEKGHDYEIFR